MRSLLTLTVLALSLALFGCGSSEEPAAPISDTPDTVELQPPAEPPAAESMPVPESTAMAEPEPEPEAKPERELTPATPAEKLPQLLDFYAVWCPPCQDQKPIVAALEKEYEGKVAIQTIDVDKAQELAGQYEVKAIPTLVFLDGNGKEVDRLVGLSDREKILGKFKEHGFID
jgi:thioredoxin 1